MRFAIWHDLSVLLKKTVHRFIAVNVRFCTDFHWKNALKKSHFSALKLQLRSNYCDSEALTSWAYGTNHAPSYPDKSARQLFFPGWESTFECKNICFYKCTFMLITLHIDETHQIWLQDRLSREICNLTWPDYTRETDGTSIYSSKCVFLQTKIAPKKALTRSIFSTLKLQLRSNYCDSEALTSWAYVHTHAASFPKRSAHQMFIPGWESPFWS